FSSFYGRLTALLYLFDYCVYLMIRRSPITTLFPYTTLFRSSTYENQHNQRKQQSFQAEQLRRGPVRGHGTRRENHPLEIAKQARSEEHTSELQSRENLVCRLLLEKKKNK